MIDLNKIAEKLRRLAKYEIPSQPFTSRQLNGILTDIADELDPPEPKPLLADAQVGDLCKHRNGDWSQIIDTNGTYIPGQPIRTTLKDTKGINRNFCLSGSHFTMQFGGEYDIIATEPLATEGSEEWAWQMLKIGRMVTDAPTLHHYEHNINTSMVTCVTNRRGFRHSARSIDTWCEQPRRDTGWQLYEPEPPKEPEKESPVDPIERPLRSLILRAEEEGKNIRTYYQDMVFTPCALDGLLADGKFRWWNISNWELTNREQNYYPQISYDEPNPEPAFKAGDWVEYNGKQYRISAIGGKGLFDDDKLIMFEGVIWGVSEKAELRKLDPSEVVIRIGCLKGTVAPGCSDTTIMIVPIGYDGIGDVAIIPVAMLDPDTATLVRALLAAQEVRND